MRSILPLRGSYACQDWCVILQTNFIFKNPLVVGTIRLNSKCYRDV